MKLLHTLVAVVALLLFSGCVEERMVWSPDSSRAAVLQPQGLCLMDVNGTLSAPVATNVSAVAWLPDSSGLVLVRCIELSHWAEAVRLLPSAEVATVESLAHGWTDVIKGALATANGDPKAIEEKFLRPLRVQFLNQNDLELPPYMASAVLCLQDNPTAEFRQLSQADLGMKIDGIRVYELSTLQLGTNAPRVLERTLDKLAEPHVAGNLVAFRRGDSLRVAPLGGGTSRVTIAENVTGSFDWTPDAKALVYAVRLNDHWQEKEVNLVRIERRVAVDATGALMAGEAMPLAVVAVTFQPRPRCLPDGRVLFASLAQQLPARLASPEARFYLVNAGQEVVPVPTPAGSLPVELGSFTVSPDGRQVAVVESGSDVVALVDLATGALEVLSPKRQAQCRTLPAWRNANELYFAALPKEGAARPEWFRWTKGSQPRVISGQWTEGLDQLVSRNNEK